MQVNQRRNNKMNFMSKVRFISRASFGMKITYLVTDDAHSLPKGMLEYNSVYLSY